MIYPEGSLCSVAPLRFICDEMLRGVGEWLRTAGYDTVMPAPGTVDEAVLALAIANDRWLITRDRGLAVQPGGAHYVVLLRGPDLQANLAELGLVFGINWLYRPFSRCKSCNTTLLSKRKPSGRHRVPPDVTRSSDSLRYCPSCDQFFWEGSHSRRMQARLAELTRQSEWQDRYHNM